MTTVAWDGRAMAADGQGEFCGVRQRAVKLRRLRDGRLVGAAGNCAVFDDMADWLESGLPASCRPAAQSDEACSVHLLEARPDGRVFLHTRSGRCELFEPFAAVGSGMDFALAAMALGKSAAEAVELAIRFDTQSGPPVLALAMEPPPA